jgi:hypothetical protein
MASCCGCRVPANSFAYVLDGPYNYPAAGVTVKLISSLPSRTAPGQQPSLCTPQSAPSGLGVPLGFASGMTAWTENQSDLNSAFYEKGPFSPAPLNDAELSRLTQQCSVATQCTCLPGALPTNGPSGLRTSVTDRRNPFGIR